MEVPPQWPSPRPRPSSRAIWMIPGSLLWPTHCRPRRAVCGVLRRGSSELEGVQTLVLHRATLTETDLLQLRRLRSDRAGPGGALKIVLCLGPFARYHLVERCAGVVDVILPEATAAEVIGRYLGIEPPPFDIPRPRVAVISRLFDLRLVLAETCRAAGYPPEMARDWDEAPEGALVVWDVPVLEEGWETILSRQARHRPVVTLFGFADRALVAEARAGRRRVSGPTVRSGRPGLRARPARRPAPPGTSIASQPRRLRSPTPPRASWTIRLPFPTILRSEKTPVLGYSRPFGTINSYVMSATKTALAFWK